MATIIVAIAFIPECNPKSKKDFIPDMINDIVIYTKSKSHVLRNVNSVELSSILKKIADGKAVYPIENTKCCPQFTEITGISNGNNFKFCVRLLRGKFVAHVYCDASESIYVIKEEYFLKIMSIVIDLSENKILGTDFYFLDEKFKLNIK